MKPTTTIRIDSDLKDSANKVFDELGISMSAAVNAFLRVVVRENGLPFEMKVAQHRQSEQSGNATLNHAFVKKRDEFYTLYEDVAKEMEHYNFRGQSVLCNCDDPFESSFFRYFLLNFDRLGLRKLICTCYGKSPVAGREYPLEGGNGAYKATVLAVPSTPLVRPDGSLDLENLISMPGNELVRLEGDGDFRSAECEALLDQSDVVVTNPPFSLFREYVTQLVAHNKKFVILGNMNASTCKEIFPLFQSDKVWYGRSIHSGDRKFYVPDDYPLTATGCGVDPNGRQFIKVKGVRWFTNMDGSRHNDSLALHKKYNESNYPRYENYNAIEVIRTSDIPMDWNGIMGVPITFLDKYNPDQFEILMLANGNARTNTPAQLLKEVGYMPHPEDRGGVGILHGRRVYARILIRRRRK